jgi:hypothetical protein
MMFFRTCAYNWALCYVWRTGECGSDPTLNVAASILCGGAKYNLHLVEQDLNTLLYLLLNIV